MYKNMLQRIEELPVDDNIALEWLMIFEEGQASCNYWSRMELFVGFKMFLLVDLGSNVGFTRTNS